VLSPPSATLEGLCLREAHTGFLYDDMICSIEEWRPYYRFAA